jgi:capsular exopolysaccharide synthesis family protein
MPDDNETRALPAPSNGGGGVPAIHEHVTAHPAHGYGYGYPYGVPEQEEQAVPLSHYLWILKRHRWKILSFVLVGVAATVIVSSRITPVYESTATIDVDRQMPSGVVGQDASRPAANDADQFLATQIQLVQSDAVLRPVVQRFHLAGAEVDSLANTKIPTTRAEDAPVKLSRLKVTRPPNTYLLLIAYRSPDPQRAADVANAVADSYRETTYLIRFRASADLSGFMEKQMEELRAKMERSSEALVQFEKDLNVINPEEKTSILSSRLLQLNTEYTNAQADRVRKQAAYDSVKGGSLEAAQASTQGEQLRKLADKLDEAKQKLAIVAVQYGQNHQEYKKASSEVTELQRQFDSLKAGIGQRVEIEYQEAVNREGMLKGNVADTKAEWDAINARSFQYKALKEEAETDKGLYEELVRKIKEAGINSNFQNSAIRLADSARPALNPVYPNLKLNAILAFLFSSLIAVGVAVLTDVLDNTVSDPEQIQKTMNTELLGSLPVVKTWRGRLLPVSKNGSKALVKGGYGSSQTSAFEEAIRTLRDSILLSDLAKRPKSLLVTSAVPREGKTTTIVHLALAHSLQKRRTLLIDADLRRPGVHARLGIPNERGLSDAVKGEANWHDLIQCSEAAPDLDVLVGGPASRRAADLLGAFLEKLLAEAESSYDLVLVDAPPLLGFAEPLQMAAVVDGVVVVTLAGQTNRNAVASVLTSLKRLKANVIGVALNEVREDMSDRYYYYGYYGKYYSKYYKPTKG